MHDLLIVNARLYLMDGDVRLSGADTLAVKNGRIARIGRAVDAGPARETVDARGQIVMPGFIDCHTHAVYAGHRADEHRARLEGASYEEIARAGGGIASTVKAVRAADQAQLERESLPRIAALAREGVTCIEIKSGYGLRLDDECKMLRAARALDGRAGARVVTTFLGAHSVPPDHARDAYMDEVIDGMLPAVAAERLADAVDIFVERIAFDCADMRRLFAAAGRYGLPCRAHTDQLSNLGATRLAAELGAMSCDHLEYVAEEDVAALASYGTVAVLLPGAFYFLRETRNPPVPSLRRHGVRMAVASDLNPGSSPVASLLTALHMACTLLGLTPDEALLGVTAHAAAALGRSAELGSLEPGKRADFCLWDLPSPQFLAYQLGGIVPSAVFVGGMRIG